MLDTPNIKIPLARILHRDGTPWIPVVPEGLAHPCPAKHNVFKALERILPSAPAVKPRMFTPAGKPFLGPLCSFHIAWKSGSKFNRKRVLSRHGYKLQ